MTNNYTIPTPWRAGYNVGRHGGSAEECPYSKGEDRMEWFRGYSSGAAELEWAHVP